MMTARDWAGPSATCVVICGGRGSRLMPLSIDTAKSLVKVDHRTVLELIVDYWRPVVQRFVFVVNHFKDDIKQELVRLQLEADVVEEEGPPQGIAWALTRARHRCGERFVVVLGDCLCDGAFAVPDGAQLGVGVVRSDAETIAQNYSVEADGQGRVQRVVEKPLEVNTELCGTGFYFFDQRIFSAIERTPPSARQGTVELTDAIQTLVDDGTPVSCFTLQGKYLNLTYPADLELARAQFA